MKVFVSSEHRRYRVPLELGPGRFIPAIDAVERIDSILAALADNGMPAAEEAPTAADEDILRLHPEHYLHFLAGAWEAWRARWGGEDCATGFVWPMRHLFQHIPEAIEGRMGYYSFDGIGPIGEGTWEAARRAADTALAGAAALGGGEALALALCRPPGHHAAADVMGGTCFLNNIALAAARLCAAGARVAIVDVDYHHGNGTQALFYERSDVLFVSLHADPAHDYPYFSGWADETGAGAGEGFTLNLPLPIHTRWQAYDEALSRGLRRVRDFGPDLLLVSLGLDTYEGEPLGRFGLARQDYPMLGARLGALGLPALFVLEGGYDIAALGPNVASVMRGFLGA